MDHDTVSHLIEGRGPDSSYDHLLDVKTIGSHKKWLT